MHEFGQSAQRREHTDVIRMIVDDHSGVRADPMQFGMDVDRRSDVPPTAHHTSFAVHQADIGRGEFLPPQAPRIDQHVGSSVELPGDVSGHVLGEPDTGQMAEGHGERLFLGQVDTDRGTTDGAHTSRPPRRGSDVFMLGLHSCSNILAQIAFGDFSAG